MMTVLEYAEDVNKTVDYVNFDSLDKIISELQN